MFSDLEQISYAYGLCFELVGVHVRYSWFALQVVFEVYLVDLVTSVFYASFRAALVVSAL